MRKFNLSPKRSRRFAIIIGIFILLILIAAGIINMFMSIANGLQDGFSRTQQTQTDPYADAEWGEVPGA